MKNRARKAMSSKGFIEIGVEDWADLKERIKALEVSVEQLSENLNMHLVDEKEEMKWIKERLNRGYRPPWSVVIIITFLTSLCVGLIVAFVKG